MKEKLVIKLDVCRDRECEYNEDCFHITRSELYSILEEYADWNIKERDDKWIEHIQKYSNCGDGCDGCAECRILEITKQQIKPELSNKDKIEEDMAQFNKSHEDTKVNHI